MARGTPLLLPLLLLLLPGGCSAGGSTLSLAGSARAAGGSPWTLVNHNGSLSLPATVPGVVHMVPPIPLSPPHAPQRAWAC